MTVVTGLLLLKRMRRCSGIAVEMGVPGVIAKPERGVWGDSWLGDVERLFAVGDCTTLSMSVLRFVVASHSGRFFLALVGSALLASIGTGPPM